MQMSTGRESQRYANEPLLLLESIEGQCKYGTTNPMQMRLVAIAAS